MSTHITPQSSPLGSPGGMFPSAVQRVTQREMERTLGQALVLRAREQARAQITSEVLEAAGALTALESHLIQIAPLGEARYKAIVDSFVLGATSSIARGL